MSIKINKLEIENVKRVKDQELLDALMDVDFTDKTSEED